MGLHELENITFWYACIFKGKRTCFIVHGWHFPWYTFYNINNINHHHHFSTNTYIKWYSSFVHYLHTINSWERPETKTTQSIPSCSFYLSALLFEYFFASLPTKVIALKVFRMSFHAQITALHTTNHTTTKLQSIALELKQNVKYNQSLDQGKAAAVLMYFCIYCYFLLTFLQIPSFFTISFASYCTRLMHLHLSWGLGAMSVL